MQVIDSRKTSLEEILCRREEEAPDVSAAVAQILADVKARGDEAVREYTLRFDGAAPDTLRVSEEEIQAALAEVDEELLRVMRKAAANIEAYHKKQVRQGFVMAEEEGVVMGQRILPLQRVGIYVPGGTAAYPSTVLMDSIPAAIAGVQRIVMVTPPGRDGKVAAPILAAAHIAGVQEIYKVGGAQAVAALCYGTESIPTVDKIVGPGNLYVATAKRLVYGLVDIDMVAGPSDVLVVADDTASAVVVAADMLAQAEHDENAAAVLVTTSQALASEVQTQLAEQLKALSRKEIAAASLAANGRIILAQSVEEALKIANGLAPEHLELCVEEPFALLPLVQNAGSVFLGHHTPEALGDYFAGPNHTLPTGGTARFYSPLSVDDFIKKSSYLYYSRDALAKAAPMVRRFAESEGLQAHANSVAVRMPKDEEA
ncbi:histidinol dehydrogenase [Ruminococcaceae bacterium OttesenSCG-928-O06]|nr:histidinol dehydrogenase [Ruminococcaceae bacterium OttesenSCG-928-O06]